MLWPINQPLTNATSVQSPRTNAAPRRADNRGSEKTEPQPISGLRSKLLYERYGILENPFGVTPNPRYFYQSRTHGRQDHLSLLALNVGLASKRSSLRLGRARRQYYFTFWSDSKTLLVPLFFSRSTVTPTISYATYYRSLGATHSIHVSVACRRQLTSCWSGNFARTSHDHRYR